MPTPCQLNNDVRNSVKREADAPRRGLGHGLGHGLGQSLAPRRADGKLPPAMWPKPVIFISAVSKELRSARDVVAKTLLSLGYEPDWEDIFGTEQGDIKAMLRRRIDAADGVIQIIGQCHGCELPQPDPDFGRVSYTQYEARYARQRGKKVWYILLADSFPADAHDPEPEELRQLQATYRQRILNAKYLYHRPANPVELKLFVHELKNELAQLRRRSKQVTALVVGLLLLLVAGGLWIKHGQARQEQGTNRQEAKCGARSKTGLKVTV